MLSVSITQAVSWLSRQLVSLTGIKYKRVVLADRKRLWYLCINAEVAAI